MGVEIMRIYKNQCASSEFSMVKSAVEELCNPEILHINRMAPRAMSIPAQEKGITFKNRYNSDRIFSLNGNYKFALFSDEAPEHFENINFSDEDWDIIDVPSMWQYRGYSKPAYPNVEYPFPFLPPNVFCPNPVGCYRKKFTYKKGDFDRFILHFEGVDNAFYVYINGCFVGFSKGSRLVSEFDITKFLNDGENFIAVKVYTYSDASYLENQDMLLASGIFRDVYIIRSYECAVFDFGVYTDTNRLRAEVVLFETSPSTKVRITLDEEIKVLTPVNKKVECEFFPTNVKLWTAETPYLYDFCIEILENEDVKECHFKRVGFRHSEVCNTQFLINGSPILFRGINRHEYNCQNGRTIKDEQIYNELKILKKNNVNAIRCSHYPNNSVFYEYASELGFYVMDEGDIETHGCGITGDQGYINKLPQWKNAFLDRIKRTVERDKNETCIVMWSVGNECGCGENTVDCAKYLRKLPFPKPIHYRQEEEYKYLDALAPCGYPNIIKMEKAMQSEMQSETKRPLLLTEYAHAMGNSPGNLREIWDFVLSHKIFAGGFAWEYKNHGFYKKNTDGSVDYLYGGDFNDDNHWSNFTLDGFMTSNGTPKPTFKELKYIYSPARFTIEDGNIYVENLWDFISLKGLVAKVEIIVDAKIISEHVIIMPDVPARHKKKIEYEIPACNGIEAYLTIKLFDKDNLVGLNQFELPANQKRTKFVGEKFECIVTKDNDLIHISGKDFLVKFKNGLPIFYKQNNDIIFDTPMKIMTYRAEIDNDGIVDLFPRLMGEWERCRFDKMNFYCENVTVKKESNVVEITSCGTVTSTKCYTGYKVSIKFKIYEGGLIVVSMEVSPYGKMPLAENYTDMTYITALPRFGVCFEVSKDFDVAKWYGRGEDQNYDDAKSATPIGVYELPVSELNFQYDVPQETGTRTDVRCLEMKSTNKSFYIYGSDAFSFSCHPWHIDNLRKARHLSELSESENKNYLYVDYCMRALGSHSCGPNPERKYDFEPHSFNFAFAFGAGQCDNAKYLLYDFGCKTEKLSQTYIYEEKESVVSEVECNR